jgi:hypothetical protein
MSTLSCSMSPYRESQSVLAVSSGEPRHWAVTCCRGFVFCLFFSILFVPEFTRDGSTTGSFAVCQGRRQFPFH